jgi:dTDP-4-amino-4,6-dideoxygalactose transaminase
MITTKNRDWDAKFRLWRQHSMSVSDTVRHSANSVIFESYPEIGFNYRMTDVQAAIGREQLKRLPDLVSARREKAAVYQSLLGDIPGLMLPKEPSWARSNWQSYCVRLPEGVDQRLVMQSLLNDGIATRRGIMCSHREPAYAKESWGAIGTLVESERAQDQCVLFLFFINSRSKSNSLSSVCARRSPRFFKAEKRSAHYGLMKSFPGCLM